MSFSADLVLGEGADVIVGDITGTSNWGSSSGIRAYSIGTESCNIGDVPLEWIDEGATPTLHPVISQNMFRLLDGRFEQIGQAWLKHGFCALQLDLCEDCTSYCNGCCDHLGVGCSDPYSSSLNGSQGGLGPKSEINPAEGAILVWPFSTPGGGTLPGRLQVDEDDLDAGLNPGALYFVEGHYIAHDDTVAGNDDNNASFREVTIGNPPNFNLSFEGPTRRQMAGVMAWRAHDNAVGLVDIDIPDDGRMTLAHRATDLGGGMWHYEYALYNMNSDRAGQSFSVPIPDGTTITNVGFHDVGYSGEPYAADDWTSVVSSDSVTWSTTTHDVNVNANALRWATLYNFRFDADVSPQTGDVTVGLFKPGAPDSMTVQASRPGVGGGEIPCGDIAGSIAECNAASALRVGIFLSDFSHDGAEVVFDIDGVEHQVPVIGQKARLFLPGQDPGDYTIELVDPAGCIDPVTTTCN